MHWDELTRLLELMKEHELSEIEFEDERYKVHFKSGRYAAATVVAAAAPAAAGPVAASAAAAPAPEARKHSANARTITSPFVGTFYRSPSPDSDPFVNVGQVVRKGQTLCIIEAMKLMNEIEAEVAGKVVEIFPQNGRPVEFGEKLFVIEPE